jgi:5,10-methylenetetrahydrofolate reductase
VHLSELTERGEFVITCELGPPKGTNVQDFLDRADLVRDCVHAINVGDNARAVMRAGSWAMCHLLKSRGIEPVMEVTTRDRNRLALQADLLGASILGIENVLLDSGHDPAIGDHIEARPVHDLDCASLAAAARTLTEGQDMAGHVLDGTPELCVGVMATPGLEPVEAHLEEVRRAVAQGAQFIQTQPVYDPQLLERFIESVSHLNVPVIVGHMMLKSVSMASFINCNLRGVSVPERLVRRLEGLRREELVEASLRLSIDILREIKPMCQGVHFMPAGWERYVARVVEEAMS